MDIAIPVIPPSPLQKQFGQGKVGPRRTYNDEPLPVKPSSASPHQARIVSRVAEQGVAIYLLKIGDVEIRDVGLDDILNYVSSLELERFENRQFEEERELLKIAEAEEQAELEARLKLQKQRASQKGVALFEERSDSSTDELHETTDAPIGRHGRARPSYRHLYNLTKERRRRKRDPVTGELYFSSDEIEINDIDIDELSQNEAPVPIRNEIRASDGDVPKRRRRRRDKVTGELLPLPPEPSQKPTEVSGYVQDPHKRPRRRRHPITKELMPLGWRYHSDAEKGMDGDQQSNAETSATPADEINHENKRFKFDVASSESSSAEAPLPIHMFQKHQQYQNLDATTSIAPGSISKQASDHRKPIHDADDSEASLPQLLIMKSKIASDKTATNTNTFAKKVTPKKQVTLASFLASNKQFHQAQPATSTSPKSRQDSDSSPDLLQIPKPSTSMNRDGVVRSASGKIAVPYREQSQKSEYSVPPQSQPKTSLTSPVASQNVNIGIDGEDEWVVDAILDHRLSDPSKPGAGPVMLYLTKWRGIKKPVWEPEESFFDEEVVANYRKEAGLDSSQRRETQVSSSQNNMVQVLEISSDDEDGAEDGGNDDEEENEDDEDGYEIEAILSHHLSDPRTHTAPNQNEPIMLYQVKWFGYDEPTWEPKESFMDQNTIKQYWETLGVKGKPPTDRIG